MVLSFSRFVSHCLMRLEVGRRKQNKKKGPMWYVLVAGNGRIGGVDMEIWLPCCFIGELRLSWPAKLVYFVDLPR